MKQYRKKPIVIEAIQFDGWNWKECMQFMSDKDLAFTDDLTRKENLKIDTLEGTMIATVGDWIIKGIAGEFYPCKPDVFATTYDEPFEPTTNCSQLEQVFTAKIIPPEDFPDREWTVRMRQDIVAFFKENGLHEIINTSFTPLELRQLADLVEETLKGQS